MASRFGIWPICKVTCGEHRSSRAELQHEIQVRQTPRLEEKNRGTDGWEEALTGIPVPSGING